jgi:hypothetical protein
MMDGNAWEAGGRNIPAHYNRTSGLPIPYTAPSDAKEEMVMRSEIRRAAGKENVGESHVMRVDPIHDSEVQYLKSMKDQAELAKFDDYVESFIDPRKPGNMKWLMEVYPDYVTRRLQQAHTDYEFALRNQMIDSWGMNTFDDLHFKYMVDQGELSGPRLKHKEPSLDGSYTPGYLSPFNFGLSATTSGTGMRLPFASAGHGERPTNPGLWTINRADRPLGNGNSYSQLAHGMYNRTTNVDDAAAAAAA